MNGILEFLKLMVMVVIISTFWCLVMYFIWGDIIPIGLFLGCVGVAFSIWGYAELEDWWVRNIGFR